jgi:hypothetical protein
MSEHYEIISHARGEPRPAGCVGVRVRVQLSGCPTHRWSHAFGGHLATGLTGHAAVGHLRLNLDEIVQGDQIVLEGVEPSEASALAAQLRRAIDAANQPATAEPKPTRNVTQREANAVAARLANGRTEPCFDQFDSAAGGAYGRWPIRLAGWDLRGAPMPDGSRRSRR